MTQSTIVRVQASSLQYSDKPDQQEQDIHDLFTMGKAFPIKTGTESAEWDVKSVGNQNYRFLNEYAKEFNHAIHFWRGNWCAVDRAIIKPRTISRGSVFVADNDDVFGPGHDNGFATFQFIHAVPGVGQINVAACHQPTKGKKPGDPNYKINQDYAEALTRWAKGAGRGSNLVIVAGDFNRPDNAKDNLLTSGPFTSVGDELKRWPDTGHGPIDGVLTYDPDARVKAVSLRVLNDKDFFQHSDHFVYRAGLEIKHMKVAA